MGTGDGSGPGHNALKNQVVGFLFAAQYMRGATNYAVSASHCRSSSRTAAKMLADANDEAAIRSLLLVQCRSYSSTPSPCSSSSYSADGGIH